jgi:aldehyde dehydrogenase (NAD+)
VRRRAAPSPQGRPPGALVTLEVGKILSEGLGEVQESIDMADLAVGMSRQLYGPHDALRAARHRMYEQWHPLGVVGVITAFNFPNAVWAWNAMVAAGRGDTCVWKPSLKAPLTAIATHRICDEVFQKHGWGGVLGLIIGDDKPRWARR